jgi:hypothetical protein
MPTKSYKDNTVLEEALTELRLTYHRLDIANTQAKNKIFIMLGGGLGLMSYLYGGGDLFIPATVYGKIVYFIGFGLIMMSLYLLFRCVRKAFWHVPIEHDYHKMLDEHETKNDFLNYITNEYVDALSKNIPKYELRQTYSDIAFFELIAGGILLLVIKNFGGQ